LTIQYHIIWLVMNKEVVISVKTILITLLMILGGYVLFRLRHVFGILLMATLIVFSLEPLIQRLTRQRVFNKKIGRGVAVLISYILLIAVIATFLTIGLPPVVIQSKKLFILLLNFLDQVDVSRNVSDALSQLYSQLVNLSGGVLSVTFSLLSSITSVVSLVILSIYMSLDLENLEEHLLSLFPENKRPEVEATITEIQSNISNWVKGEFILMVTIGVFCFIGLIVLDVKYPLALSLVAGLMEAVPVMGPIFSAVVASVVGFSDSPVKGLGVIVLFILIHQTENNLLVPKVMQKVSGFSPLIILIALLVGSEFFGIAGAVLAIPMTMIGAIFLKKILGHNR
jgi:predicted PurR-regulated permease PerM